MSARGVMRLVRYWEVLWVALVLLFTFVVLSAGLPIAASLATSLAPAGASEASNPYTLPPVYATPPRLACLRHDPELREWLLEGCPRCVCSPEEGL